MASASWGVSSVLFRHSYNVDSKECTFHSNFRENLPSLPKKIYVITIMQFRPLWGSFQDYKPLYTTILDGRSEQTVKTQTNIIKGIQMLSCNTDP